MNRHRPTQCPNTGRGGIVSIVFSGVRRIAQWLVRRKSAVIQSGRPGSNRRQPAWEEATSVGDSRVSIVFRRDPLVLSLLVRTTDTRLRRSACCALALASAWPLAVSGCGETLQSEAPPLELRHQADVVALIWERLGGTGDPPPVRWVEGYRCNDYPAPAVRLGATCVVGWWDGRVVRAVLVAPERGLPYADSALVHEFLHAVLERNLGDPDGGHTGTAWALTPPLVDWLREGGL